METPTRSERWLPPAAGAAGAAGFGSRLPRRCGIYHGFTEGWAAAA